MSGTPASWFVAAVNDLGDPATNAHLFKYDSNYGAYSGEVGSTEDSLLIDGAEVKVLAERNPGRPALGRSGRGISWSSPRDSSRTRRLPPATVWAARRR